MIVVRPEGDAEERALVREGRHAEAAERCLARGDPARAAELFAAVWQWERAVDVVLQADRPDLAVDHALASGDPELMSRARAELAGRPGQAAQAAERAAGAGHPEEAGRLWELAGEPGRAAEHHETAGRWLEAGRCHETAGRYRDAGRCYERRLRQAPWDGDAGLRLGRLLAQFGRHDAAVRALQKAAGDPSHRAAALRLLVACFDVLGFPHAAAASLDRLRSRDPALAPTVDGFLEESFGDRRGLAALGRMGREELLAGRYRVLESLGAGATGRVVSAQDVFLDRRVAIKVLAADGGVGGRDALARFEREARLAAALDHPNVVRVHEYHEPGPFMVMEHMEGGTLEERLAELRARGRVMAPARARRIAEAILEGLDAVHRRGVVHRDLKPANVFFGAGGEVKIGDFGVAHLVDRSTTRTGAMLGTLAYMAPEQITGAQPPGAATDLYAVGVLLFEMLTGGHPYPGPDVVSQHLDAPVPRPSRAAPGLGETYDALIRSLLAKAPEDRPASARAVLRAMTGLPWPERAEGEAGAAPEPPEPPPDDGPEETTERYQPLDAAEGLFRDTRIGRTVRIRPCDAAGRARWRRAGAVDDPHLQAVLDVDPEAGRVVLEVPAGEPWARVRDRVAPEVAERACRRLRAALERLHRAGGAHGAVRDDRVVVGPGRAVLLWPEQGPGPETEGPSLRAELEALERVFGINGGKPA